ncbi:MAG: histidine kinase dimerization/phospho-acceptor domain-containing protein, partial [Pseudomonadota bacterium]
MYTASDFIAAFHLPCLFVDPAGRIEAANDAAVTLLGQGGNGRHYISVLRQPSVLNAVENCIVQGTPGTARFLGRADADHTPYTMTARPIPVGGRYAAVLVFEDTSAVDEISQIRRDFVANVSHELRTPLTAIMGLIDTLQGPAAGDDRARARFLKVMESEAGRMNALIRDLLSLSKVEADQRVRPRQKVDIFAVVDTVFRRMTPRADALGATLIKPKGDHLLTLQGDFEQLVQVFTNLVENALKYGCTGPGGHVTLKISHTDHDPALRGPGVRVDVIDEGVGIDPLDIPRLTERFYRVDDHRSRDMGGTGLG